MHLWVRDDQKVPVTLKVNDVKKLGMLAQVHTLNKTKQPSQVTDEQEDLQDPETGEPLTNEMIWNMNNGLGIFIVVIICMCDIGSIACLQLISNLPPDFELNTLRFAVGLVFSVIYFLSKRKVPKVRQKLAKWVFVVALATYFYNVFLFNGYVKELPVGAVIGLKQGFFIILIAIASWIILKERHSQFQYFLTLTTFLGVVFVTMSSFLPDNTKHNGSSNISNIGRKLQASAMDKGMLPSRKIAQETMSSDNGSTSMISISFIFCCALFGTIENLVISETGLKAENYSFLSFWYFLFGAISSFITSVLWEDIFIPHKPLDQFLCLIHCTLASAGTFLLIIAFRLMNPSLLSVVFSVQIPLALVTQMFLLQSVTPPVDVWMLVLGLSIITISVLLISIRAILFQSGPQ